MASRAGNNDGDRFTLLPNHHHRSNNGQFEDFNSSPFPDVAPFSDEDDDDHDSNRRSRQSPSDDGDTTTTYLVKRARIAAESSGSGSRKDREEWSDVAIGCLLEAFTDKYLRLNRGGLRGRDWEEVAVVVSERCFEMKQGRKSVEQCKNKVDNLKKRFKLERHRMVDAARGGVEKSSWPWFEKMEVIVGNVVQQKRALAVAVGAVEVQEEDRGSGSCSNLVKRYGAGVMVE